MKIAKCPNGCDSTFTIDIPNEGSILCEVSPTGAILDRIDRHDDLHQPMLYGNDWECSECQAIAVFQEDTEES